MNRLLSVLALAVVATASAFAQQAFATDVTGTLYRIDLSTGASTLIGGTGLFFESLARNENTNVLYGATDGGILYTLDQTTGAATLVGDTGLGNIEGLDFAGNNLWATDFGSPVSLHQLDPATAAPGAQLTSNVATGAVRSMAFDANFLHAYLLADNPGPQTLYSMGTSGATTAIGQLSTVLYGMDLIGGKLWGLSGSGDLYTIDETTAAITLQANTGNQFWLSMTSAEPVPEPASLLALGAGLAAFARRRKRS